MHTLAAVGTGPGEVKGHAEHLVGALGAADTGSYGRGRHVATGPLLCHRAPPSGNRGAAHISRRSGNNRQACTGLVVLYRDVLHIHITREVISMSRQGQKGTWRWSA